jgi:hypothetical protein
MNLPLQAHAVPRGPRTYARSRNVMQSGRLHPSGQGRFVCSPGKYCCMCRNGTHVCCPSGKNCCCDGGAGGQDARCC